MTMQDSVEISLYIKEMLFDVLSSEIEEGVKLPTEHVTDISLKNAIYSNSQVKDKRLRIDLASLKQEIGREEILVKEAENDLLNLKFGNQKSALL